MARTNTSIKATREYQVLLSVLGSEELALAGYRRAIAEPEATPEVTDPVAALVATGMSVEQAERALGLDVAATPPAPLTSKERGEALKEAQGFSPLRGRVYVTSEVLAAAARVQASGDPEIVATSGAGRTKAVLLVREESGDVSIQNGAFTV